MPAQEPAQGASSLLRPSQSSLYSACSSATDPTADELVFTYVAIHTKLDIGTAAAVRGPCV
jgi:hypothetical protein